MRPVKCNSCKKFFDADKYEICPHCNQSGDSFPAPPVQENVNPQPMAPVVVQCEICKKFYDASRDQVCPHCNGIPSTPPEEVNYENEEPINTQNDNESPKGEMADVNVDEPVAEEKPFTAPVVVRCELCNKFYDSNRDEVCPHCNGIPAPAPEKEEEKNEEPPVNEARVEKIPEDEAAPEIVTPVSISEAVKNADSVQSNDAIERFVDEKTVAFYNLSNDVEPVVGWLVGLKGEYKGVSFNLKSGRNYIGRSLNMDVALAKENTVSRDRHAVISFDPKQRKFFIQSGESRGLTYVNGELLMSFKEIGLYDVVSLGACDLMFVPLCSDRFSWDNIR